jgi:ketosteroid isomerase-like protein
VTQESTPAALEDRLGAFTRGDNERVAARYHDDVDWLFHAPISLFPFAGARRGKAEVFKGFGSLYHLFSVSKFTVVTTIVEGDRAATMSEVQMLQRATGRIIRSRIAGFHRFKDGKVIEYRGFTDSFHSVEQTLGRELEL